MKRRDFITLLSGAAAAWPLAARAQQAGVAVLGYLDSGPPNLHVYPGRQAAFRQSLNSAGFFEGRNLAIEYRWAEGQNERLAGLRGAGPPPGFRNLHHRGRGGACCRNP